MFKQLLSDNRIFGGVICVLVFIAGGLIYLQVVKSQANLDIQRTQDRFQQRENPQAGEAETETTPGGHYHPDGTYHAGAHEKHTPSASTTPLSGTTPHKAGPGAARFQSPLPQQTPATRENSPLTPAEEAELKALKEQWLAKELTREAYSARIAETGEKVTAYLAEAEALRNKPGRTSADEVRIVELGQLMKEQRDLCRQLYEESVALKNPVEQQRRRERYGELIDKKAQAGTTASEERK